MDNIIFALSFTIKNMINRIFDKQNIIKKLRRNPSVAILGPRQVGKTSIAKEIAKEIKKKQFIRIF
jgi:predicted AAA+ superfamily ATPase